MLPKWYLEVPIILFITIVAIVLVCNIDSPPDTIATTSPKRMDEDKPKVSAKESINQQYLNGKAVFKSNCASCHNISADGTGPALNGVNQHWKTAGRYKGKSGEQWLRIWIKNWREPVEAGYPYAIHMANSRAAEMNIFPSISDQDLDALFIFIQDPNKIIYKPQYVE